MQYRNAHRKFVFEQAAFRSQISWHSFYKFTSVFPHFPAGVLQIRMGQIFSSNATLRSIHPTFLCDSFLCFRAGRSKISAKCTVGCYRSQSHSRHFLHKILHCHKNTLLCYSCLFTNKTGFVPTLHSTTSPYNPLSFS